MSTLRISNIEAKSVPASATIDEKVKITNSSGDPLVFIDGKTSGITTVGINTTDGNITFDANSNVVVTGIITATRFSGQITPTSLEIGSNIKLGNAGVITATSFVGSGANLTSLPSQLTLSNNADNRVITGGSGTNLNGESNLTFNGSALTVAGSIACDVNTNIDMSSSSAGQLKIGGSGYTGAITLNDEAMFLYHNSSSRYIGIGVNETEVGRFASGGYEQRFSNTSTYSTTTGSRKGIYVFNSGATTNCYASLELGANNSNGHFGSTILNSIAVSYTHLTLPTTPYV